MRKNYVAAMTGVLLLFAVMSPLSVRAEEEMFSLGETIEETVLVDEMDVKITATELVCDEYSATVNLLIENNTDKDLTFYSGTSGYGASAVNGYMNVGGSFSVDVSAGKKAFEEAVFRADNLLAYGISDIAEFDFGFVVKDAESLDYYIETGAIKLKTSIYDTYDFTKNTFHSVMEDGTFLSENDISVKYYNDEETCEVDGVGIDSTAFVNNYDDDRIVLVEAFNSSDKIVDISYGEFYVNGLKVYSGNWTTDTVNPGCRAVTDINLDSCVEKSFWDSVGISEFCNVKIVFAIEDREQGESGIAEVNLKLSENAGTFDNSGEEVYNENNISVVSKGIIGNDNGGVNMLFIVTNNSDTDIKVDTAYDSLSINGFMASFFGGDGRVKKGESMLIDIEFWDTNLEDVNIASASEIENVEFTFDIKDYNYNEISSPVISVNY